MEATITEESQPPSEGHVESNVIQDLAPEHKRVVALKVQGKRWSEIAAALGVTPWTIWYWRERHPEIDAAIASESNDYLESAKHGLASLLPLTQAALAGVLKTGEHRDQIAAAKVILETFKRPAANAEESAMLRRARSLTDAELDAAIDVEPDAEAKPR
jgi:hypothetical protein